MRILVITYSREVNPGTFLQAFAVQFALKKMFPNAVVELLKHERLYSFTGVKKNGIAGGTGQKSKRNLTWLKSKILALPRRLKYEYANIKHFRFTSQTFSLFNYDMTNWSSFVKKYDLIVIGSDTILTDLKVNEKYGIMWLLGINGPSKILFAASAAPVNYATNISDSEKRMLYQSFMTYDFLGVRDKMTYDFFSNLLGLGEIVQCQMDPTYLLPLDFFSLPWLARRNMRRMKKKGKIALVNFGADFIFKKVVVEYIKSLGYFVVSTVYNPWADKNFMTFSPFQWAGMYEYVDLTVTERFHDSVFTLMRNKLVVAIDWEQVRFNENGLSKTNNLLLQYSLENFHCIVESENDLQCAKEKIRLAASLDLTSELRKKNDCIKKIYQEQINLIEKKIRKN